MKKIILSLFVLTHSAVAQSPPFPPFSPFSPQSLVVPSTISTTDINVEINFSETSDEGSFSGVDNDGASFELFNGTDFTGSASGTYSYERTGFFSGRLDYTSMESVDGLIVTEMGSINLAFTSVNGGHFNSEGTFSSSAFSGDFFRQGIFSYIFENTAPTLSDLPDFDLDCDEVPEDLTVGFTALDAESIGDNLVYTVTSSNPDFLPNDNLSLSGSGNTRAIAITPVAGALGQTTITLTVSDGELISEQNFNFVVKLPELLIQLNLESPTNGNVAFYAKNGVSYTLRRSNNLSFTADSTTTVATIEGDDTFTSISFDDGENVIAKSFFRIEYEISNPN